LKGLVHTTNGGDHALFDFTFLFTVFDDLKVLVFTGLFDPREHLGASLVKDTPNIAAENNKSQGLTQYIVALPFGSQKKPPLMFSIAYRGKVRKNQFNCQRKVLPFIRQPVFLFTAATRLGVVNFLMLVILFGESVLFDNDLIHE
jgi:hypothetical protein